MAIREREMATEATANQTQRVLLEPAPIQIDPHARAIASLRELPLDILATGGGAESAASMQTASPAFLPAYFIFQNEAVKQARVILGSRPTLPQLRHERDKFETVIGLIHHFQSTSPAKTQPPNKPTSVAVIDQFTKRTVVDAVRDPSDRSAKTIRAVAHNLAIMALEDELEIADTITLLEKRKTEVNHHTTLMRTAREQSSTDQAKERYKNLATTDYERAFLATLDRKLTEYGYIPNLQIVTDMDKTLSDDAGSAHLKPGNSIGNELDQFNTATLLPIRQRLPITDNPLLDPQHRYDAEEYLRESGRRLPIFEDAKQTIDLARAHGIPVTILTANMTGVARGASEQLNNPQAVHVIGLERDSCLGYEKSLLLTKMMAEHPDNVIVFSDDGDTGATDAIISGRVSPDIDIPLENIVFFATRETDQNGAYRLQQALAGKKIPHATNKRTEGQNGKVYGFQGVSRTLELYIKWKDTRLSEGWKTKTEALGIATRRPYRLSDEAVETPHRGPVPMPELKRATVLHGEKTEFLPDGQLNWKYWIGTASVVRDAKGKIISLFKGTDEPTGRKAISNIGHAQLGPDGVTVVDRHPHPVVFTRPDQAHLYPHGFEDTRVTKLGDRRYLLVSNVSNKDIRDKGMFAHKDQRLKGVYIYLHAATDIADPESIEPLGMIGPDFYFKNAIVFPEVIERNGEPHIMLMYRDLPDIQASLIPLKDLIVLAYDEDYRRAFWERELATETKRQHTILQPLFRWEAKGDSRYPIGQISGGSVPVEVSFTDKRTGQQRNAWLFTYNATTGFDEAGNTLDRVVGICLLDRNDPFTVIARSPDPIITPVREDEVNGRYPNITFTVGTDISPDGELRIYYTAGDQNLNIATCQLSDMLDYLTQYDAYGQLKQ